MSTLFFSPSCPSGGNFYACDVGANFVGCCKDDPCDDNGCSAGNLEPASFDSSQYGKFADQECPSDSKWYTCKYTHPPFMGCCKSSPCGTGCNATDLTAGYLSSNPTLRAQFLPSSTSSAYASHSSGSNSESATSPMSATASETGSEPQTAAATTSPIPHKTNTGAIAGGITGGGIFLVILVGLLLLYCYKGAAAFRLSRKSYGMSSLENPPATTAKGEAFGSFPDESEHTHYQDHNHASPTPTYTSYNSTGLPKYAAPTISEMDGQPNLSTPHFNASDGTSSPTFCPHGTHELPDRTAISSSDFGPASNHINPTPPTGYFPPPSISLASELPSTEQRPRVEMEDVESTTRMRGQEI